MRNPNLHSAERLETGETGDATSVLSSSRRDDPKIAQPFKVGFSDFTIALVPRGRLNACMSYVSSYHHCVFSTKERRPLITLGLQDRLWPYLGGIAREHKMTAVEVGGVADHVHMLLSLASSMPIAKAVQLIKGGSNGCMILFPSTVCSAGK